MGHRDLVGCIVLCGADTNACKSISRDSDGGDPDPSPNLKEDKTHTDTSSWQSYVMALLGVLVSGFETGRRDPIDPHVLVPDEELEPSDDLLKCSACCSRV